MKQHAFGLSDVGRRRENNQDQFLVDERTGVYAIADGMGGHAAGEVASQIAIQALSDAMRQFEPSATLQEAGHKLVEAFNDGNRRICESVMARGEWRGMGTTIVAMIRVGGQAVIGHVGDSRAYLFRDGELRRLTEDHSWVGEQVRMGLLTDDEAHRHPMKNIVTRAMGNRMDLDVDVTEEDVEGDDIFLLCSDGLNSMLTDEQIAGLLRDHAADPEAACRALVDAANERGGDDNITVIVLSPERVASAN